MTPKEKYWQATKHLVAVVAKKDLTPEGRREVAKALAEWKLARKAL